jgi:transcriptional regulator
MYVAAHFALPEDQSRQLLAQVGAADLVTVHERGPVATYLPFLFDPAIGEHGTLLTHVARNNSQAREPVIGEALVIAHGPDHYIAPGWLPSQAETGQVVPTWNYLTVHAYGELTVHDDPDWVLDVVTRTTAQHERTYSVDAVPPDFVARQLRAIVGIEVRLTRLEAKAKMSQNKMPADVLGIIEALRGEGAVGAADAAGRTADWMEQHSLPAAQRRAALIDDLATGPGGRRAAQ